MADRDYRKSDKATGRIVTLAEALIRIDTLERELRLLQQRVAQVEQRTSRQDWHA